jgi:hypothetical protein
MLLSRKRRAMPKDELDPEDPLEAIAVELPAQEDTLVPMAETFIEEFMRMGYSQEAIAGMFQNPFYAGPLMVTRARGTAFVRQLIADTFRKWGRGADVVGPLTPAGASRPTTTPREGTRPTTEVGHVQSL